MEFILEAYQGPLDLLLKLIQRHEIDIYDIPIATLTNQYLQEIANLPPDMGQLSEFLVMAATLLEIKSKMLLPRPKTESGEPEEDPREALARQLIAYQQAQSLAALLNNLTPTGESLTGAGEQELLKSLAKEAGQNQEINWCPCPHLREFLQR